MTITCGGVEMFKCQGCTTRHIGCHTDCKEYLETKEEYRKQTLFVQDCKHTEARSHSKKWYWIRGQ